MILLNHPLIIFLKNIKVNAKNQVFFWKESQFLLKIFNKFSNIRFNKLVIIMIFYDNKNIACHSNRKRNSLKKRKRAICKIFLEILFNVFLKK